MGENLKLLTCANHQLSTKILPVIARWVIYDTHSHSRSRSEQLGGEADTDRLRVS